ncbi:ABC transporter permease [Candidatus Entotheonella palauensis]|nr:ABC transporter permease [Candidatus Entotheonella palauensis]
MLVYLIRRILYVIPIALGVSVLCFSLVHLAPGDPLSAVVAPDAPKETVAELKKAYGFDKPLPVQYIVWLSRALTGDLGISIATNRSVSQQILLAVPNTLILAAGAAFFGFTMAVFLGIVAGFFQGRWMDRIVTGFAVTGVSVPHYWLGLLMVIVFSVQSNLLPAGGMGAGGSQAWQWDWAHLRYAIMPIITLSVIPMGIIARTVRAAVAEILGQEFVQTLHAKGLLNRRVLWHIVKNATPTVLAVSGLQLGYLLGGSILVETVFNWPGSGKLLKDAIDTRDLPMLQGTILVLAMFFVVLNLLVDMLQSVVDPRMRRT